MHGAGSVRFSSPLLAVGDAAVLVSVTLPLMTDEHVIGMRKLVREHAIASGRRTVTMLLVDGLGHGPEAAKVAQAAIATLALALAPGLRPERQIEAAHEAMGRIRGAALAVAQYDADEGQLYFAGVGNIGACIIEGGIRRQLMSHNGIVGHNMRKLRQIIYPCAPGALTVMHSDGIATQWDLEQHPGLAQREPALVAGVLLRDYARQRDDACVLVHRVAEVMR